MEKQLGKWSRVSSSITAARPWSPEIINPHTPAQSPRGDILNLLPLCRRSRRPGEERMVNPDCLWQQQKLYFPRWDPRKPLPVHQQTPL